MVNRISDAFLHYVNTKTPYQNLVDKSSFYRKPIISQITMLICALLTACCIVNRASWGSRQVSNLTDTQEITPLMKRQLNPVPQLNVQHISKITAFNFEETIPASMELYTCVCPYKPCGYTEFTYSELAQGPSEQNLFYQGAVTSVEERRAIQQQRNQQVEPKVNHYFKTNRFDNYVKQVPGGTSTPEFTACHSDTIFELCYLNQIHLFDSLKNQLLDSSKTQEVQQLIQQLRQALIEENKLKVAEIFLKLREIPNSLPPCLFQAAFGDMDGDQIDEAVLPASLEAMKQLYREFVQKGYPEATVRNIVAYYYHKGSFDPIKQAKQTLQLLPKAHYVVIADQIKQV